jgi:itaconate CoA-transferase
MVIFTSLVTMHLERPAELGSLWRGPCSQGLDPRYRWLSSGAKSDTSVKGTAHSSMREQTADFTDQVGANDEVSEELHALYKARRATAAEAMSRIPTGSAIAMGLAPCHPQGLLKALARRAKAKSIRDIRVYYSVSSKTLRNTILRFEHLRQFEPHCMFFGATERELATRGRAEGRERIVHYVPNYFYQADRMIAEHMPVHTFMTTVSPMDENGYFSLGTNSDYSFLLSQKCQHVVLEVNRFMPRVHGPAQIHISNVSEVVENDVLLEEFPLAPPKDLDPAVARNVVELIPDGATLQMGIGSLPSVVCQFLNCHNDLGIHTELLTSPMGKLMETGVVNNSRKRINQGKTIFTFALGDRHLYEYMNNNPCIEGHPVSCVNDPHIISMHDRFISINSTLEIDLTGQCNSEYLNGYQYSGAGGQVDFVRGAYASSEGKSIMVLHSTAADGEVSRIVPQLHGPVTTSRMDTHWVVTEHGSVNLKGKSEWERMKALISIAAPQFREVLLFHAKRLRVS